MGYIPPFPNVQRALYQERVIMKNQYAKYRISETNDITHIKNRDNQTLRSSSFNKHTSKQTFDEVFQEVTGKGQQLDLLI